MIKYARNDFIFSYKPAEKYFRAALEQVKKIKSASLPKRWEPLLNNLGHTCRKLKKYKEALEFHHQVNFFRNCQIMGESLIVFFYY